MAEALAKVKRDLGREAVILHTRTLRRGGWFGLGGRRLVEITATCGLNVLHPAERRAIIGSQLPARTRALHTEPSPPGHLRRTRSLAARLSRKEPPCPDPPSPLLDRPPATT
jgi:flagellar biosynthesis protein FlhF